MKRSPPRCSTPFVGGALATWIVEDTRMPRQNVDLEEEIRKLTRTIARLMKDKEWPTWDRVAREQEGSEELTDLLRAYAEMTPYSRYFVLHRNRVTLTEQGLRLAARPPSSRPSETQEAADAVKSYASSLRKQRVTVESIARIGQGDKYYVHAIHVPLLEGIIPSETPVLLRSSHASPYRGRIVGQEPDGGTLYVAFPARVYASVLPATLEIDRGFLLHQLAEQLGQLPAFPGLVRQMFTPERVSAMSLGVDDSVAVADRMARFEPPWMRFLWGPPGAGKTHAIGRLVTRLLQSEPSNRTLLVAPSNRAVDVATEQLVRQMERIPELGHLLRNRNVLRFGYARKPGVLARPELLGPAGLDLLTNKVRAIAADIVSAERRGAGEAEVSVMRSELLALQEEVKGAIEEHVAQCRVVATTTTLAYLSTSPVAKAQWNTVLVDEVTMVPPAMCAFLGSLADRRLLLAGDPRQLGPVYERNSGSNDRTFAWMGEDVFVRSGISTGTGEEGSIEIRDARLVRITSQRRCAADIWDRVKHLYPTIRNAAKSEELGLLTSLPPLAGQTVVIWDTSGVAEEDCGCVRVQRSWQNKYTAKLCLDFAYAMVSESDRSLSIAIIAPYRAQVKLIRQRIREKRADDPLFESIEAGTVHQFQGSDADAVIFDLVDGPGRSRVGWLLRHEAGVRLVNVALTRAKGKLVIVANRSWYRNRKSLKQMNPLLWAVLFGDQVNACTAGQITGRDGQLKQPPQAGSLGRRKQLPGDRPTPEQAANVRSPGRVISKRDGKEMVRVPAGPFKYEDEKKTIELPEYWIDKTPVTNGEYARFVAAGHKPPQHWKGDRPRDEITDHPVVYVSWHDAVAYCEWAGKRLPSEEEWEKAARGTDGRKYPRDGRAPTRELCNSRGYQGYTTPVGTYSPKRDSPYGCMDMSGNVWEWTATRHERGGIVVRGGSSLITSPSHVRSANRYWNVPDYGLGDIGFRCARGSD